MTQGTPDAETIKSFNKTIADEFRANDGKVGGPFKGADLLLLTTTGAKSGEPRISPLAYFRIDGKLLIIGPPPAPTSTRPGCTICVPTPRRRRDRQRRLGRDGPWIAVRERDELFGKITAAAPGLAEYQAKTSPGHPGLRIEAGESASPDS